MNLDNNIPCTPSRQRIERGLKLCELNELDEDLVSSVDVSFNYPLAERTFDGNDRMMAMSDRVCLKVGEEDGRGIFARDDIAIGEGSCWMEMN